MFFLFFLVSLVCLLLKWYLFEFAVFILFYYVVVLAICLYFLFFRGVCLFRLLVAFFYFFWSGNSLRLLVVGFFGSLLGMFFSREGYICFRCWLILSGATVLVSSCLLHYVS